MPEEQNKLNLFSCRYLYSQAPYQLLADALSLTLRPLMCVMVRSGRSTLTARTAEYEGPVVAASATPSTTMVASKTFHPAHTAARTWHLAVVRHGKMFVDEAIDAVSKY